MGIRDDWPLEGVTEWYLKGVTEGNVIIKDSVIDGRPVGMQTTFPYKEQYANNTACRHFQIDGWFDMDVYAKVIATEKYPKELGKVMGYFVDETRRSRIITMKFEYGEAKFYFSKTNRHAPKVEAVCTRDTVESARLPGVVWVGE
jgi:hypothetical protein